MIKKKQVAQNKSSLEQIIKVHDEIQTKTCPSKAVAHVCIDHREVGFQDGLFKDEVDGSLQPLLCVNCQLLHLFYELLKLLRGEFVEDTTEMLK